MARQFELFRGDTLLGVVTLDPGECDLPWFVGRLEPSPAYAAVRPLFERLDQLLDAGGFDDESSTLHEELMAPVVRMRAVDDGEEIEVDGIAISGTRVSWR